MPPFRPAFQSQFGYGTQYDDENCAATAGCMALSRHTLGRKTATPPQMRQQTDQPNRTDGLSLSNIEYAWREGWDEDLVNPLPFEPFSRFVAMVKQGRGAIIFGDCRVVRQGRRCPGRFPRDHALYVNEIDDRERALTYDSADRTTGEGVRWVDLDVLRRYAENWTINEGSVPGMVNAAYTKITGGSGGTPDIPEEPIPDPPTVPLPAGCAGSILSLLRF